VTGDLRNTASSSTQGVHPGLSATRERFAVILGITVSAGLGTWRYLLGDGSGFLFLGVAALLLALFVYGLLRQRRVAPEGPPDPSTQWRLAIGIADRGDCMFRYSSGSIWAARIVALISLLFGPAIYFASSPRPSGSELYGLGIFFMLFSGAFFLVVRACERFGVEVTRTEIVHHRLRSPLTYSFQALGSIALLEGSGRGPNYLLALYDPQGRCVDQFASTLDGFENLVALVKERAFENGLKYRYRDMWGSWTT
jgi:hypothetical protein